MPSIDTMQAAVHRYIRTLNESDLEGIVALYAPDAVVEDPVGSPPHCGHAAIRAFYAGSVALGLQVQLEGEIRATANVAAFAFRVSFVWNGQATTISPIDVFRFNEQGLITEMRAIFGPANTRAH